MSHTVTIKTQFKDPAALDAALKEMGLKPAVLGKAKLFQTDEEFSGHVVNLPGWKFPVIIDTKTGEAKCDNYNGHWGKQEHLNRLTQLYAVHKATIEAKRKGYFVQRREGKAGAIQVVVTGV